MKRISKSGAKSLCALIHPYLSTLLPAEISRYSVYLVIHLVSSQGVLHMCVYVNVANTGIVDDMFAFDIRRTLTWSLLVNR